MTGAFDIAWGVVKASGRTLRHKRPPMKRPIRSRKRSIDPELLMRLKRELGLDGRPDAARLAYDSDDLVMPGRR